MSLKSSASFYNQALPYVAMVLMRFGSAGMPIVAKYALNRGMSQHVLVVYRFIIATLVLAPFAIVFDRKVRPKMTLSVFVQIALLGLLEPAIDQNLYYTGIKYTTATVATALSNVLPAFVFLLAWVCRLEKVDVRKVKCQAKILGTIGTVAGAMIMTIVYGPMLPLPWTKVNNHHQSTNTDAKNNEDALKGAVMILVGCVCWACFVILQAITLKSYPAELSLTTLVCFMGAIEGGIVALVMERGMQQRLSSRIEFTALFELRSSLGLRSRDWPRKVDPCTSWNGIRCENGSVTSINISGFRRTRVGKRNPQFDVNSLANFTRLVSFNASEFLLPGPIPDWFGQRLLTLQVLDLRSCNVSGVIPLSIDNLTNLTTLYLSDNRLTGQIPSTLGRLLSLLVLDLSKNSLTGSIPSSLVSLRNLTSLDISLNNLTGSIPPGVGSLLKLQILNLSSNRLTSSIPAQLGDLDSLVDLDLSSNGLSGSVPRDLRGLRNLQTMDFGNNGLQGSLPVALFPSPSQLRIIVLRNNSFSGDLPEVLWSLPELNLLDISHNNFTGMLPNSTLNDNATAAVLNISQNKFYGGLTTVLRRFISTDLSGNYFEGRVPDYAHDNAFLSTNCLQGVSSQRTLTECVSFYAERGLSFDNFGPPNSTEPPAPESRRSNRRIIILAAVLGGAGLVVLLMLLLLVVLCFRKRSTRNHRGIDVGAIPARETSPSPLVEINFSSLGDLFTYQQLLEATGYLNDANLIKHGHSGDLFKGILEGGLPVVIKRIDLQSIKKDAYLSELEFFSKVSHPRVVPLLGHCLEREHEKFLVYKYMPNGDLSSSLYRKKSSEDDSLQSLDWITRLKIAIGAAESLSFLHHECTPSLVHRDVQASSILLDDKFEVRLGSLSEVCAHEGDGHQNRITKLLRLPQSSEQGSLGSSTAICAYDVYCFGKVLLGLVTGKLEISSSSDTEIKEWLEQTLQCISIYDKELVTKILDPSLLVDDDLLEEVWAMAIVARSCLNPKPSRRPPMRYILKALENPLRVVREDNTSSARLRTTSSRGSWNAALFGSWRQSSLDVAGIPAASTTRADGGSSFKHSGTTGSQGSAQNGGGDHSSSRRRHSKEIFPEPPKPQQDIERQDRD